MTNAPTDTILEGIVCERTVFRRCDITYCRVHTLTVAVSGKPNDRGAVKLRYCATVLITSVCDSIPRMAIYRRWRYIEGGDVSKVAIYRRWR
jgi:hypothetical protein